MKIEYGRMMIQKLADKKNLVTIEYEEKDVATNIIEIIKTHQSFSKSMTFGEKGLGKPEEYEKMTLIDNTGKREFEYYNKGIYYMMMGSEKDRPVFQVFAYFMSKK